ncbi:DEAD/DEAH box helicase [Hirsutella rhossiliensis]|uniref:RNA helicase n=1 Tax=Hirsutella rhossiliensis TaxID=111463 RepID=A0A9P8SLE6_9HYPO|nr:DEAD/DEAH box helicase domain-containing protein [Hirsutella rhossiliensis]KAH0967398.1 DEAD/DEAH box helicase domain-containing protein [Hirsutella rhossiliensis]
MAATKHKLAPEAEAAARPSKKSKVDSEAQLKTETKEGKDGKNKKKEKKDKKRNGDGEDAGETADADAVRRAEKEAKKVRKQARKETKQKLKEAGEQLLREKEQARQEEEEKETPAVKDKEEETAVVDKGKGKKKNKKSKDKKTKEAATAQQDGGHGYVQTMSLSSVPQADIDAFLATHQITVTDPRSSTTALRPVTGFDHLPSTNLLEKQPSPFAGFKAPTPIQAASWPFTLSGRDVVGVAETGSGKTMAFALPCVEAVSAAAAAGSSKTNRPTRAVVVSPTRELAMQTYEQMARLAALVGLRCVCLYGGASKDDQRVQLQRGCDVVVATPGRLKDFMADGTVDLGGARFVVLDEADRMLDKGFEDDIRHMLSCCPAREHRQTLMFTATWPQSVQALASSFMVDPVKVTIGLGRDDDGSGGVELQANARIAQSVEVVDPRDKEGRLLQILKQRQQGTHRMDRILVFCLYKKEATRIEALLSRKGIRVAGIHGDLRQEQRTRSLEAFKSGNTPVLVATDVAARGLDIPEVKLVINVTFPLTIEDYVHRIGRTGRAGNTGEAITLFTVQDKTHSGSLVNILRGASQPVPEDLLKFGTTVKKKTHDMYGSFFKDVDMSQKATKITFD